MNTQWLEDIKTAKLPKLVAGMHDSPSLQQMRMPRKAVLDPVSWQDYSHGDGPMSTTINFRTVPHGEVRLCAMEMVAFMEGEEHSDFPKCVCPLLSIIMQNVNDTLPGHERDNLLPYLPLCVGTKGDGLFERRKTLWIDFTSKTGASIIRWFIVKPLLDAVFSLGKPTGFTKPERIRELEALTV